MDVAVDARMRELVLGLLLLGACGKLDGAPPDDAGAAADDLAAPPDLEPSLVTRRPYTLKVPSGYDPATPTPLVLALHGYGNGDNGPALDRYFQLGALVDTRGFLYSYPEGTVDGDGQKFWNATDACCDLYKSGVDDVAYLRAVIDDVAATHNVDAKRIYVTGLSAGAVMAHRVACDLSDKVAAVVSLSGTTWKDATKCTPTGALALVEVHADHDDTLLYAGGASSLTGALYPSAHDTVAHWAGYNGCAGALAPSGVTLDLDTVLAGPETTVERYAGCQRGAVELWTIVGGAHAPHLSKNWAGAVMDFFLQHPKP